MIRERERKIECVSEEESERERDRVTRWNERESETGIAGEQLRTRATYDSTPANYARRGVERFDKTRLFAMGTGEFPWCCVGRFLIRLVFARRSFRTVNRCERFAFV